VKRKLQVESNKTNVQPGIHEYCKTGSILYRYRSERMTFALTSSTSNFLFTNADDSDLTNTGNIFILMYIDIDRTLIEDHILEKISRKSLLKACIIISNR
jgi:hypothetical protein